MGKINICGDILVTRCHLEIRVFFQLLKEVTFRRISGVLQLVGRVTFLCDELVGLVREISARKKGNRRIFQLIRSTNNLAVT